MSQKVITRFPPSPTGYMHIGNVRSCFYGWLIARQTGGKIILRIEDTDKKREVPGGVEYIEKTFSALKLNWDEEFLQSDRLDTYKEWAEKLYEKGLAYADNVTPAEVEAWRADAKLKKKPFLYRDYITKDRIVSWEYGLNTLRIKSNPKSRTWHDEVRGALSAGPDSQDDIILMKSDGYPTYNFAHIVDDYLMDVTHIFRADEFIASYPNYLNIYEALKINPPKIVTVPPIMSSGGKKKLSKREGAKSGLDYLEDGVLVDALLNFLALMGWNPGKGDNQEIFTLDELIKKFSIAGIGKSGANYDEDRLKWINGHHIRNLSLDKLYLLSLGRGQGEGFSKNFWLHSANSASDEYKKQVLSLIQERLKLLSEIPELTNFFFEEPKISKIQLLEVKNIDQALAKTLLQSTIAKLKNSDFSVEDLQTKLNELLVENETKPGILFALIRNAVSGSRVTPPLAEMLNVLGKEKVEERLSLGLSII